LIGASGMIGFTAYGFKLALSKPEKPLSSPVSAGTPPPSDPSGSLSGPNVVWL
jgi:hypothetical protein